MLASMHGEMIVFFYRMMQITEKSKQARDKNDLIWKGYKLFKKKFQ